MIKIRHIGVIFTLFVATIFLNTSFVYADEVDLDMDGVEDSLEELLIDKYAPSYYFHTDEKYYSDNVDEYLSKAHMRFHYRALPDDQILEQGNVNQENLAYMKHNNKDFWGNYTEEIIYSKDARDVYGAGGFFLEIPDNYDNKDDVYKGDIYGHRSKIYAHLFKNESGNISIQYWVFLPYNEAPSVGGVKLNHEGDWEHITVRLDESYGIEKVYFASHNNEGKYYNKEELLFGNGDDLIKKNYNEDEGNTHVIVYLALGTHASFPTSGTQYRGWYLPNDYTSEGKCLHGKGSTLNIGEKEAPLNNQKFIQYGGLWGEIGNTIISTGPKSPSFQESWMKD